MTRDAGSREGATEMDVETEFTPRGSAAVVSLHFSPAHASHMIAYGRMLRELGYRVSFVLDEKYLSFAGFSKIGDAIAAGDYARVRRRFDLALFYNSAAQNRALAGRMRAHGTSVVYIFHEPESIWNLASEGWRQIVRFPFSTYCSVAMLRIASGVLVPSAYARSLYERYYLRHNPAVFTMPLVFEDEIASTALDEARRNKRFFGFIGSVSKGHGIDEFLSFAKYAIRNGSTIPFVLATRRNMGRWLARDEELSGYAGEGKILLHHGRVLPNDEINRWYLDSFCVWNVYRRSTQSGVLPRAFMAGTPVLVRRIGSFPEYVREGETGEFVESGHDAEALLRAAERIRGRCGGYVDPCRETFLRTFHYKANSARLAEILDQVQTQGEARLQLAH